MTTDGHVTENPDLQSTATELDFADLLEKLTWGIDDPGEFVSVCHKFGDDGEFRSTIKNPSDAVAYVNCLNGDGPGTPPNIWFGVNPINPPARGRGKTTDVRRLSCLWIDLDVKPGGCDTFEVAHAIVAALSEVLGQRPVAIIHSGHGLQPLWAVDSKSAANLTNRTASRMLQSCGSVVKAVARTRGCGVDSVFDLPRILRVPGTINSKYSDTPVPTRCEADSGRPLTVDQIQTALYKFGPTQNQVHEVGVAKSENPQRFSRQALTRRVNLAPEGRRNVTLYGAAKDAARQGGLDDDLAEKLADAAEDAGPAHPRSHRLHAVTEFTGNPIHRSVIGGQLSTQGANHPHHSGLVLRNTGPWKSI